MQKLFQRKKYNLFCLERRFENIMTSTYVQQNILNMKLANAPLISKVNTYTKKRIKFQISFYAAIRNNEKQCKYKRF